nr:transposase [Ahniella affigens]
MRAQCFRKPDTTTVRPVAVLSRKPAATHTQTMRERIDSDRGQQEYSRCFATVEPEFGNLRHNKELARLNLRGQRKVNEQWNRYVLVHNN